MYVYAYTNTCMQNGDLKQDTGEDIEAPSFEAASSYQDRIDAQSNPAVEAVSKARAVLN